jgi:hypothetical protein
MLNILFINTKEFYFDNKKKTLTSQNDEFNIKIYEIIEEISSLFIIINESEDLELKSA